MLKNNITGLQHIGIPTKVVDETVEFYKSLDFEIVSQTFTEDGNLQVVFLKLHDIVIEAYESIVTSDKAGAIDHIALNVKDVKSVFEYVKLKDYKILDNEIQFLPFFDNGVKFFAIEGPNGEKIEFNEII